MFSILIVFTDASSGLQRLCKKLDWGEKAPNTCLKCCKAAGHVSVGRRQRYPMRNDTSQATRCDRNAGESANNTLFSARTLIIISRAKRRRAAAASGGHSPFHPVTVPGLGTGLRELLDEPASPGLSQFLTFGTPSPTGQVTALAAHRGCQRAELARSFRVK